MNPTLSTILFLLISIPAFSSNPSDSLKAQVIFDEGQDLYKSREFEAAIRKFERSSALFKTHENYNSYLESKSMIANSNRKLNFNERSIKISNQIIKECNELEVSINYEADAYRNISSNYMKIGSLDSALIYSTKGVYILEKSKTRANPKYLDDCYNQRSAVYIYQSKLDSAIYYAKKSLYLRLKLYGKNSLEFANITNNIGAIYNGWGENNLAAEYFIKSNNIRKVLNINNPALSSYTYTNLAICYNSLSNYKKALKYNLQSLNAFKLINKGDQLFKANIYNNIGTDLTELNRLDSAISFLEKSQNLYIENSYNQHYEIARVYNNLGLVYEKKKQPDKAFKLYSKSLNIYLNSVGNKHIGTARVYYNLAYISKSNNDYHKAHSFANNSIQSNIIDPENKRVIDISIIQNFRNYNLLLGAIFMRSISLERIYKNNQLKKHLIKAKDSYYLGCQVIDSLKSTFTTSADKIELLNVSKNIFEGAIRTNLILYKLNANKKASNSLQIVQNYKSTLLVDNKEVNAALSDSLRTEIRTARKDFSNLRSQILREETKSVKDSIYLFESKVALFDLKRKKEYLENSAERNKNKSSIARYTPAQQVMDSLDLNTMVLEYFVGDSSIYLFTLTKNDYIIKEIVNPLALSEDIETLREGMRNPQVFAEKSFGLYRKLIAPANIGQNIKNIIIIPDGTLWKLNFETLLTSSSENTKFSNMPFLLKKYSVSYASTSNFNKQSKKEKTNNKKMLAFSYNEQDDNDFGGFLSLNLFRDSSKNLPGSSKEIKEISNIIDGDYHYGNEASENIFKTLSSNYQIIHMALHGEANEEKPDESKLIFYSKKDTLDDGLLFGFELANMELNADLVVLSACNTGAGKIKNGVGIMSLGRSFSTAGVHSLLLSKWEVSDVTAPFILKYFYEELKQGMRKSEALQLAKLKFLENDADNITASPYYWNSFYILGDDSPIVFESTNSYWKQLLIGLIILLVIGGFFWKRSISKVA